MCRYCSHPGEGPHHCVILVRLSNGEWRLSSLHELGEYSKRKHKHDVRHDRSLYRWVNREAFELYVRALSGVCRWSRFIENEGVEADSLEEAKTHGESAHQKVAAWGEQDRRFTAGA